METIPSTIRAPDGKFKKGVVANPAGRGTDGFAKMIREYAGMKELLVETMINIIKDVESSAADKIRASEFLADRGFGKPAQVLDVIGTVATETPEELQARRSRVSQYLEDTGRTPLIAEEQQVEVMETKELQHGQQPDN